MESRRLRCRRLHSAPFKTMEVKWNFTADEYDAFRTFFNEVLEYGQNLFAMITQEPDVDPLLIRRYTRGLFFLDGTYKFEGSDNLVTVSASLEIDTEEYGIWIPFFVKPEAGLVDVQFIDADGFEFLVKL